MAQLLEVVTPEEKAEIIQAMPGGLRQHWVGEYDSDDYGEDTSRSEQDLIELAARIEKLAEILGVGKDSWLNCIESVERDDRTESLDKKTVSRDYKNRTIGNFVLDILDWAVPSEEGSGEFDSLVDITFKTDIGRILFSATVKWWDVPVNPEEAEYQDEPEMETGQSFLIDLYYFPDSLEPKS